MGGDCGGARISGDKRLLGEQPTGQRGTFLFQLPVVSSRNGHLGPAIQDQPLYLPHTLIMGL